jgi:hypothetical protein
MATTSTQFTSYEGTPAGLPTQTRQRSFVRLVSLRFGRGCLLTPIRQ